jgi:hypothetical protein
MLDEDEVHNFAKRNDETGEVLPLTDTQDASALKTD